MNVEDSSNAQYQKFQLEDSILKETYLMLHSLHVPFIPNVMSTFYTRFPNYLNNFLIQIYYS